MNLKIINQSSNPLPSYATKGSSGMDLRANLTEPVILQALDIKLIPTGIHIELPEGFEAQVRPRSGLALKRGLSMPNTPATIDSDYRGELKVILINLSKEPQTIQHGDRIAQMVICAYQKVTLVEVDELTDTERGKGGFGHTGEK